MSGFLRTFLMGMGYLGLLLLVGMVTLVVLLAGDGVAKERLRDYVLTEEDRTVLRNRDRSRGEVPAIDPQRLQEAVDRKYHDLANHMNESVIKELMETLSQREGELQRRADWLDRREAELRLHQGDLARLDRQLVEGRGKVEELLARLAKERSAWAESKLKEHEFLQVLDEIEKAQWQRNAQMVEKMQKPWDFLKALPIHSIAMNLALMDQKKAARILDTAAREPDGPELLRKIHDQLMAIDLDGLSANQAQRLAGLYNMVDPVQVVELLAGRPPEEMAAILNAMELKRRAAVVEALRKADPARSGRVEKLLVDGVAAAGGGA